ncbi:MAG: alpha/beta fold hydrolase [Cyanobacteria bacterium P01_A01_bin.105]
MTTASPPLATVHSHVWTWQGFAIRYQQAGSTGHPILLVHGFGAHSDHWRKNLPVLGQTHRVYAIDLIGYGQSDKPKPGDGIDYTFETWGEQVIAFCQAIIGEPAYMAANSIGCVVVMQAAVQSPDWVTGLVLMDCSLRLLHDRKRQTLPWYRSAPTPYIQKLLNYRPLGRFFFSRLATPRTVSRVLKQAYGHPEAVTDELVQLLLAPARDPNAVDVFLAFISYSQGPIPEDLLPQLTCPVHIIWGEVDPWEPLALARAYGDYPAVQDFVVLPGVGHCPQDEAPERVNPLVRDWVTGDLKKNTP